MNNNPIGVFDSGIGGITVLDSCRARLPHENFVYVCDPKHMPYGNLPAERIRERVDACVRELLQADCKAVVAACNTATNVGISWLRSEYKTIFVGLEPALKPAKEACGTGGILVLCTRATAAQPKFGELLARYGGRNVIVAAQSGLAEFVEQNIDKPDLLREKTFSVLQPYGSHIRGVVLGCTHYVFLRPYIQEFYRGEALVFDGNEGAAKRLGTLLAENDLLSARTGAGGVKFISL